MAEIADGGGGGGHKGGKKRAKKSSTRVDMTPMVDLAFLLLTFFVMTSTFNKPKVLSLVYPAKKVDKPIKETPMNNGLTFLLSEDKIFYYSDQYYPKDNPQGKPPTQLTETNFGPNGVRKLLAERNRFVLEKEQGLAKDKRTKVITEEEYKKKMSKFQTDDRAVKVNIKTDDKATCKNFIDLIDELKIAKVGIIAPVDMLGSELELLKAKL